jgi:hypothetical protein
LSTDLLTAGTTVLTNANGLFFPLASGTTYLFAFDVLFKSVNPGLGLKLGLTFPAAVIVSATAYIPFAADGAGGEFQGWITSSGDSVTATGVETADTIYKASIEGTIRPSVNGNLQLQYASELSTAAGRGVVIKQQSAGVLMTLT